MALANANPKQNTQPFLFFIFSAVLFLHLLHNHKVKLLSLSEMIKGKYYQQNKNKLQSMKSQKITDKYSVNLSPITDARPLWVFLFSLNQGYVIDLRDSMNDSLKISNLWDGIKERTVGEHRIQKHIWITYSSVFAYYCKNTSLVAFECASL